MKKQIEKLPAETHTENGRMLDGDKEQTAFYAVVVRRKGEWHEPVRARVWMGRSSSASVVYASVWASGAGRWYAGHGRAGGYGYHKKSAAIDAAIRSSGITLSASISGVGDGAIRDALAAIARALGYRVFTIVEG
jgi:hypothetical protein